MGRLEEPWILQQHLVKEAREARRELEEIFQREMQQERRQLDGWDEFE